LKYTAEVKVRNRLGLHIRPATMIVKLLQGCRSNVFFSFKGMTANAKSIMSLLVLSAQKNAKISILVEGDDAKEVLQKLIAGFESKFGE
jgi:phosphocarrier protein HPr